MYRGVIPKCIRAIVSIDRYCKTRQDNYFESARHLTNMGHMELLIRLHKVDVDRELRLSTEP